jgi:hypothetical protein
MKQKDIMVLATIVIVAAVFSIIVAGKVFNSSDKHKLTAPEVSSIDSSFPNIRDEPAYNTVFNDNAIDPTQLIKIGTSQNDTPFKDGP